MRKEIASFHYLTQDLSDRSHEEQVRIACKAGVKWIQLRVKNKLHDEWLGIAQRVKRITDLFEVTLIVNDSVKISKEINADGVHLGREDFSPIEARRILGEEKIIGYSTHSFNELLASKDFDVDYFGLGPFRFTSTKEKLDAVLGLEGTRNIILQARAEGILKPIIAIGGIQLNDVVELIQTGIDGAAVSSAINLANDSREMLRQFHKQLQILNFNLAKRSLEFRNKKADYSKTSN